MYPEGPAVTSPHLDARGFPKKESGLKKKSAVSPARQSQFSILSKDKQISDVWGDGELGLPSESRSSGECEVSSYE